MKKKKQVQQKLKEIENKLESYEYKTYGDRRRLQTQKGSLKWVLDKEQERLE